MKDSLAFQGQFFGTYNDRITKLNFKEIRERPIALVQRKRFSIKIKINILGLKFYFLFLAIPLNISYVYISQPHKRFS